MLRRSLRYLLCLIVIAGCLFGAPVMAQDDDISIFVSLNRDKIGLDEQVTMTIKIKGAGRDIPPPDLPTLSMFDVRSQGQSSNYQVINGVVTQSVTYRYGLIPRRAGEFPIGNISVVYKNKRYKGNDVLLSVIAESSTVGQTTEQRAKSSDGRYRLAFLEAEVDNATPYVNEQVTLTLKFYIAATRHSTPDLTWPTATGFWFEPLGNITTYRQRINNQVYKVYDVKAALFPTQTGELALGRAMMTSTVSRDFFRFGGESVTSRSNPITLKAKPLPATGRPDKFTGTIGKFKMRAQLDKTTVEVNQPITMTVRITGTGNIKSVAAPIIPESPDFRVYQASAKENVTRSNYQLGGTKLFEEVFVPRRPGKLKIPAVTFNFFNPTTGKYEEVHTREIPITVVGGERVATNGEVPYVPSGVLVGNQANDIRYLKPDIGDLSKSGELVIHDPFYLTINGLPILGLLGVLLYRRRQDRLAANVGYARARSATRLARKRLARAKSLVGSESSGEFFGEISRAVISFLADKLNISPHGLTTEKIAQLLTSHGAETQLVNQTVELLRQCDFARYTPSGQTAPSQEELLEKATQLMVRMGGLRFE